MHCFKNVLGEIIAVLEPNLVVKEKEIVTIRVSALVILSVDLTIAREQGLIEKMIVAW